MNLDLFPNYEFAVSTNKNRFCLVPVKLVFWARDETQL